MSRSAPPRSRHQPRNRARPQRERDLAAPRPRSRRRRHARAGGCGRGGDVNRVSASTSSRASAPAGPASSPASSAIPLARSHASSDAPNAISAPPSPVPLRLPGLWVLPSLQASVRDALDSLDADAGQTMAEGATRAWDTGVDTIDAPVAAAMRLDAPDFRSPCDPSSRAR